MPTPVKEEPPEIDFGGQSPERCAEPRRKKKKDAHQIAPPAGGAEFFEDGTGKSSLSKREERLVAAGWSKNGDTSIAESQPPTKAPW